MPAARKRWQATVIITLFILAVAGAAFTGWRFARESPPHQGPIVLITVDGLRADRLPAYGGAPGRDAEYRRARGPWHRLRARIHPFTADAARARGADLGPASVRERRSRRGRLRAEGAGANDGGTASQPRLQHGRGRLVVPPAAVDRPRAGILVLRRGHSRTSRSRKARCRSATGSRRSMRRTRGSSRNAASAISSSSRSTRASADAVVGRLVDELKRTRRYDDSTIVLTADHGDAGSGATLDDSVAARAAHRQAAGRSGRRTSRSAARAAHRSCCPTMLDLVRAPMPSGLRGRSLRAILDKTSGFVPDQPIYAELLAPQFRFDGQPLFALSNASYRFVRGIDEQLRPLVPDAPNRRYSARRPDESRARQTARGTRRQRARTTGAGRRGSAGRVRISSGSSSGTSHRRTPRSRPLDCRRSDGR